MPPTRDIFEFSVLAESDDWIAVDKPAPLQIHPSRPDGPPTLWHGLRQLLAYELAVGGSLSIINRLDRETSGVVLIAKHAAAARRFHKAMMRREVRKEYRLLVTGWPEQDGWSVDAPLLRRGDVGPTPVYLMQMVHPDGAPARTDFRVERRITVGPHRLALLQAFPHTGRMHQIRVHARHSGHPVVGDKLYGPDENWYLYQIEHGWTPEAAESLLLPRHALHSSFLAIREANPPGDQDDLAWHAPLPDDFLALLSSAAVPGRSGISSRSC